MKSKKFNERKEENYEGQDFWSYTKGWPLIYASNRNSSSSWFAIGPWWLIYK